MVIAAALCGAFGEPILLVIFFSLRNQFLKSSIKC